MKVILSARVEADIASQLEYGLQHFGPVFAERTFARIDTFLFQFLPNFPYAGISRRLASTKRGSAKRRS
jgi:hypothetical protein